MKKRFMLLGFLLIIGFHFLPALMGTPDPSAQRDSSGPYREAMLVQARHEKEIMRLPGVKGVGIGAEGQALRLLVLYDKAGAPPTMALQIENLQVRFYPVDEIYAQGIPLPDGGSNHRTRQNLPTPMGVSGGHALICSGFCTGGTLGFKVCDASSGQVGYITNNHVAASGCPEFCPNTAPIGTAQYQRGSIDNACAPDQNIGSLSRFVAISFGGSNQVDGAFVASSHSQVSSTILDIGTPTGTVVDPPLNSSVQKSGRTTGLTTGKVVGKNLTININYGSACGVASFTQQLMIAPDSGFPSFSAAGDSGSPVTDLSANPVGLHFAGDGFNGFANPIGHVLAQLNVVFGCAGPPPPPPPPSPPPDVCPATTAVQGSSQRASTLALLHQFRGEVLALSPRGQRYTNLFAQHSTEGVALLLGDAQLRSRTKDLIEHFVPMFQGIVERQGVTIGEKEFQLVEDWMTMVSPKVTPPLRGVLDQFRKDMRDPLILSQFGVRIAH